MMIRGAPFLASPTKKRVKQEVSHTNDKSLVSLAKEDMKNKKEEEIKKIYKINKSLSSAKLK